MYRLNRKYVLLPLLILVLGFLGWQIYVAFGHNGFKRSEILFKAEKSQKDIRSGNVTKNEKNVISDQLLNPTQHEYLRLISEYQITHLKKLIARDYESIAISNRNAAKAMFETEKLATVKGVSNLPKPTSPDLFSQDDEHQTYKLVYTGQQYGKWFATLRYKNKLYDLEVGNILPDGSKVTAITQHALITNIGQLQREIGFYTITEQSSPREIPHYPTHVSETASTSHEVLTKKEMRREPIPAVIHSDSLSPFIAKDPFVASIKNKSIAQSEEPKFHLQKVNKTQKKQKNNLFAKKTEIKTLPKIEIKRENQKIVSTQKNPDTHHYSVYEQTLLKKNPHYFAIQLMGNANLSEVRAFVNKHHLQQHALYYKTHRNGHPWYVVIYRQFPNSQLALQDIRKLPIELQRWSPFVKSYEQVQTEIRTVG